MRSTEVVNARLLSVDASSDAAAGGDTYEGGGGPGPPGPSKWQGDVGVFYEERAQRTVGQQGANEYVWRTLVVRTENGIEWAEGDVVAFRLVDDDPAADPRSGSVSSWQGGNAPRGAGSDVILTLQVT